MITYLGTLGSCLSHDSVEFKTDKTGIALSRELKKQLGCTGFKFTLLNDGDDYKEWKSSDFYMTLNRVN